MNLVHTACAHFVLGNSCALLAHNYIIWCVHFFREIYAYTCTHCLYTPQKHTNPWCIFSKNTHEE